jgi:hypothetical protein
VDEIPVRPRVGTAVDQGSHRPRHHRSSASADFDPWSGSRVNDIDKVATGELSEFRTEFMASLTELDAAAKKGF